MALRVDDVAARREELEAKGVTFFGDTIDSGVCFQAFFADPDGNPLILHHRYAPWTAPGRRVPRAAPDAHRGRTAGAATVADSFTDADSRIDLCRYPTLSH